MCTDRAPWDSLLRCTKRKVPSLFLGEGRSHSRSLASGPNPSLGGENGGTPPYPMATRFQECLCASVRNRLELERWDCRGPGAQRDHQVRPWWVFSSKYCERHSLNNVSLSFVFSFSYTLGYLPSLHFEVYPQTGKYSHQIPKR